jgi:hypothetical protein
MLKNTGTAAGASTTKNSVVSVEAVKAVTSAMGYDMGSALSGRSRAFAHHAGLRSRTRARPHRR